MKKIFIVLMTAVILLSLGCSRKDQGGVTYLKKQNAPALAYDDLFLLSDTAWEGTGYNPEGPAGAEGQMSPAFRDMSNLYGRMTTDERSRSPSSLAAPGGSGTNLPENYERKLVKRASVSIRAENLETTDKTINDLLKQYDAYSASTTTDENSRRYSLRVPAHFYEAFLADINGIGRELSRFEVTEDVTLHYYDLEGRLATKKELLRTYQSYLGRAANIEEILKVEAKISELQYDIDHTGIQLRNLANQVDYATIELTIYGPVSASARPQGDTFSEKIKRLFGGFGGFLAGIVVGILGFVIYGIPILAIIVLFFWLLFGKIGLARKIWSVVKK